VLAVEIGAGALFYKPKLPRREETMEELPGPIQPPNGEPPNGEPVKAVVGEDEKKQPSPG
jgi:hypothetical protein